MHFHYDDEFCACGWRVVGQLDEEGLCYEWHTLVVMADASGRRFWTTGAGCSCNDVTDIEESELAPIDRTQRMFLDAVRGFPAAPAEKPKFYAMVQSSRFGVSTHLERNVVTVYA